MTDTKKISELESLTILAADDILTLVDFDALVTKRMSVDSFFNFIPAGVNVGLGYAAIDNWGLTQVWNTGSPSPGSNCGGAYLFTNINWATDNANTGYSLKGEVTVPSTAPVGGYPTGTVVGVDGKVTNVGANSVIKKMLGSNSYCLQRGGAVTEMYGAMAQCSAASLQSANVGTMTGAYIDSYTAISAGVVTVTKALGAEIRTFSKTTAAGATSAITTAYGLYSSLYCQQEPASTSTIGTAYNIYLTDLRPGGGISYGPVTTYYGLFIKEATKAATNWAIYSEGRHHFDQPTADAAIPVLTLDQADISEGFINFIGSDRGIIAGATASAVSVRVELGGVVYRLALYADA